MNTMQLIKEGYRVENVKITEVSLGLDAHGPTFKIRVEGYGFMCDVGGYRLDNDKGIQCIVNIINTVGVGCWEQLSGQYIRVAISPDGIIHTIGNIMDDTLWFDMKEFFSNPVQVEEVSENDESDSDE